MRIRSRCGPRSRICGTAPPVGAQLRSLATWRSWERSRRACARLRAYGVGRDRRRGGGARTGARAAGRRRARQGLTFRRSRSRGGGTRMTRVLIAGLIALIVSIVVGPRFIEFLRANEFGQHIREDGPEHHLSKQGTPTMGGLMILFAATVALLAMTHFTLQGLTVLFATL